MSTLVQQPVRGAGRSPQTTLRYRDRLEESVDSIARMLSGSYRLSRRAVAVLLLQGDPEIAEIVARAEGDRFNSIWLAVESAKSGHGGSFDSAVVMQRRDAAVEIVNSVVTQPAKTKFSFGELLSRLAMHPVAGLPILALVTWFGLYQFVGVFGGGTVVGWLEKGLFGDHINPWVTTQVEHLLPWKWLSSLFVGDYGMWTLGVTYAVALIFPIVGTFFLAFSVLEDTGYFPRLAMLIDRLFKQIGLNGKAVIPIVLGFGCDTMATIVTRILETKRERIIATFLLSLAIPCSAQIGVMTALLGGHPAAFGLWVGVMAGIFLLIGYLTSKLLPGESAKFAMELPPLRWPSPANIATKTIARMHWYFLEVFPLFIVASVFIWVGQLTGLFQLLVKMLIPVAHLLGLPSATAQTFLFGFFRRDYGAAGLYDLQKGNVLNGNQLLVAVVTLTIFLPCIAQFLMVKKERGWKMAVAQAAFIFPFAIFVGAVLNLMLSALRLHV